MTVKLVSINIPSRTKETLHFYQNLLGIQPGRALSDNVRSHELPMEGGAWLWVTEPQAKEDTRITAYFAVDDLNAAITTCLDHGGHLVWGPEMMITSEKQLDFYQSTLEQLGVEERATPEWGKAAIIRDPDGHFVGLVNIEPHSHIFYNLGKYAQPIPEAQLVAHGMGVHNSKNL